MSRSSLWLAVIATAMTASQAMADVVATLASPNKVLSVSV